MTRTVFEETRRLNRVHGKQAQNAAWALALEASMRSEEEFLFYMACFEYYDFLYLEGTRPQIAQPRQLTRSVIGSVARLVLG